MTRSLTKVLTYGAVIATVLMLSAIVFNVRAEHPVPNPDPNNCLHIEKGYEVLMDQGGVLASSLFHDANGLSSYDIWIFEESGAWAVIASYPVQGYYCMIAQGPMFNWDNDIMKKGQDANGTDPLDRWRHSSV